MVPGHFGLFIRATLLSKVKMDVYCKDDPLLLERALTGLRRAGRDERTDNTSAGSAANDDRDLYVMKFPLRTRYHPHSLFQSPDLCLLHSIVHNFAFASFYDIGCLLLSKLTG